jgi:hypothetical protein
LDLHGAKEKRPVQHRAFKSACSFVTIAACASSFFWSTTAHAQATEIAKKLLDEAKTLREAGKISAACPLLDRSYQLDAKDGVLFARADCRDNERKIVAAVSLYEAYLRAYSRMTGATRTNHASRAAIADARIKELQPLVPMVKFIWAEKPPEDTLIKVDGEEYRASTLESKLPLEPGTHEIVILLPGEKERRRTVTLAEGGSTVVDLTPLPPEDPNKGPNGPGNGPHFGGPKLDTKRSGVDPLKVGGFIGIGLGVAGIVTGSVLGGLAIQDKKVVAANCDELRQCEPKGLEAAQHMQTMGNGSTAAFIAGGVIAGVGATLLVVSFRNPAPTTARVRLNVGSNGAQLGLEGTF